MPDLRVKVGEDCLNEATGAPREANHAARHQLATGDDPTSYAYGNQRARQARRRGKRWERRAPVGW